MGKCLTYHARDKIKVPKKRFASRAEVEVAIKSLYEARPDDNRAVQPYKCNKCGFWHFGKPTARKAYGRRKGLQTHEEFLVGKLIGILRGTYPAPPRIRKNKRATQQPQERNI